MMDMNEVANGGLLLPLRQELQNRGQARK